MALRAEGSGRRRSSTDPAARSAEHAAPANATPTPTEPAIRHDGTPAADTAADPPTSTRGRGLRIAISTTTTPTSAPPSIPTGPMIVARPPTGR